MWTVTEHEPLGDTQIRRRMRLCILAQFGVKFCAPLRRFVCAKISDKLK